MRSGAASQACACEAWLMRSACRLEIVPRADRTAASCSGARWLGYVAPGRCSSSVSASNSTAAAPRDSSPRAIRYKVASSGGGPLPQVCTGTSAMRRSSAAASAGMEVAPRAAASRVTSPSTSPSRENTSGTKSRPATPDALLPASRLAEESVAAESMQRDAEVVHETRRTVAEEQRGAVDALHPVAVGVASGARATVESASGEA